MVTRQIELTLDVFALVKVDDTTSQAFEAYNQQAAKGDDNSDPLQRERTIYVRCRQKRFNDALEQASGRAADELSIEFVEGGQIFRHTLLPQDLKEQDEDAIGEAVEEGQRMLVACSVCRRAARHLLQ